MLFIMVHFLFLQVYEDMPQICVDVPPAYTILEKFVLQCQLIRIVGDDVVKKLPVRWVGPRHGCCLL